MKHIRLTSFLLALCLLPSEVPASVRSDAAESLVRLLYRNADNVTRHADEAAHAAELKLVEHALARHGPVAEEVLREGGVALLAATRRHGEEVIAHAVRVPEATGFLAGRTDEALKLAKRFGDDGLRVEAAVPRLLSARPQLLTRKEVRHLAQLPPEQLRSLGAHLAHVADARTASRLVEAHRIHGPSLLEKIPKRYLVAGGVITVLMIDTAVNELTGGDGSRILDFIGDILQSLSLQIAFYVGFALAFLLALKWAVVWVFRRFVRKSRERGNQIIEAATEPSPPDPSAR